MRHDDLLPGRFRLGVLAIALAMPCAVSAETAGHVTWDAGGATPYWNVDLNWAPDQAPANPTAGTVFIGTAAGESSKLDADRSVATLQSGKSGLATSHTVDLNTHTLTIEDRLVLVQDGSGAGRNDRLTVSNGTLRIGSDSAAAKLEVLGQSRLSFGPAGKLDTHNTTTITVRPYNRAPGAILDLRGAKVVGGTLSAGSVILEINGQKSSFIYLDNHTTLDAIEVSDRLSLGDGRYSQNKLYIGNPDDGGKLPPNIDVRVGVEASARGDLTIGRSTEGRGYGRLIASSGGNFVAYLNTLRVGVSATAAVDTEAQGTLNIAAMTNCTVDAITMSIGTDRGSSTDNCNGTVYLPPGTVTAGDVTVGGVGKGTGLVRMSNTVFTVTNSIAIKATGDMVVQMGRVSGGLILDNVSTGALSVAAGATITLRFLEPAAMQPHNGLAWAGAHEAALAGMIAAGKLIVDDEGLAGKTAEVYSRGGTTYVGLPPPAETIFVLP